MSINPTAGGPRALPGELVELVRRWPHRWSLETLADAASRCREDRTIAEWLIALDLAERRAPSAKYLSARRGDRPALRVIPGGLRE